MKDENRNNSNDRRWFAVMVKSRHEKVAAAILQAQGLTHFLPLRSETRQWSDRFQTVELPLFPGYLFAQMNSSYEGRLCILQIPAVLGFVSNHKGPVPVPDTEIEQLQALLSVSSDYTQLPYLVEGELVRVVRGPLEGIEGKLLRGNSNDRLTISIELLRKSLSVQVSRDDVEPVLGQVPQRNASMHEIYSLVE
jgi:transcription antitermination factor NusG